MNKTEQAYDRGRKAAANSILRQLLPDLGKPEKKVVSLMTERAEAIATLRDICDEYGDNDWPDNLHLSDIIEKHLLRPLLRKGEK